RDRRSEWFLTSAGVAKNSYSFGGSVSRGEVQSGVPVLIRMIHVGAAIEQQLHDGNVAVSRSPLERRTVSGVHDIDAGFVVEKHPDDLDLILADRIEDR